MGVEERPDLEELRILGLTRKPGEEAWKGAPGQTQYIASTVIITVLWKDGKSSTFRLEGEDVRLKADLTFGMPAREPLGYDADILFPQAPEHRLELEISGAQLARELPPVPGGFVCSECGTWLTDEETAWVIGPGGQAAICGGGCNGAREGEEVSDGQ